MVAKKKATRVLTAGPKACIAALRALAAVGASSGDSYTALRNPSLWPHETHEAVKHAWTVLGNEGSGFEVPSHVVSAALEAIRGLKLVAGFKVRLPADPDGEGHPTFIKGTGRNPAFLRMRDFTDALVVCTEATLSRDARAASRFPNAPQMVDLRKVVREPQRVVFFLWRPFPVGRDANEQPDSGSPTPRPPHSARNHQTRGKVVSLAKKRQR